MRFRIRVAGATFLAVLALGAAAAGSASAHPKLLLLRTAAGAIPVGGTIDLESTDLVNFAEQPLGTVLSSNVSCEHAFFPVLVSTNDASTDVATATSDLNFGDLGPGDDACASTWGPVILNTHGFPWTVQLKTTGSGANLKGLGSDEGSPDVEYTGTFLERPETEDTCTYATRKYTDEFVPAPAGAPKPLILTFAGDQAKLKKHQTDEWSECAAGASLDGEYHATYDSETVEQEVS